MARRCVQNAGGSLSDSGGRWIGHRRIDVDDVVGGAEIRLSPNLQTAGRVGGGRIFDDRVRQSTQRRHRGWHHHSPGSGQ